MQKKKKIVDSSFWIIGLNLMHPSYRMSGLGVLTIPNEGTSISFMDSVFVNLPTCKILFATPKSILTVLWQLLRVAKIWITGYTRPQPRQRSAFFFQLPYCKQVSFSWSVLCHIFVFLCFSLVIVKWPPNIVRKWFLSTERLWHAYRENTRVRSTSFQHGL